MENIDVELIWDKIIESKSIMKGHFHYGLDWHTNWLIDTNILFHDPEFVEDILEVIQDKINIIEDIEYIFTANHRGGYILSHYIADYLNANVILLERDGETINPPANFKYEGNCIIVDDGINTGNTIKQVLQLLGRNNIKLIKIIVLFSRYIGNLEKDFDNHVDYLLEIPIEFGLIKSNECETCKKYLDMIKNPRSDEKDIELLKLRDAYDW